MYLNKFVYVAIRSFVKIDKLCNFEYIRKGESLIKYFDFSTQGLELADFPTRELIFGLTSLESYLDLSAQDLEFGFNETRRDRILRTYVRNVYHYHLNEIFSALKVSKSEKNITLSSSVEKFSL